MSETRIECNQDNDILCERPGLLLVRYAVPSMIAMLSTAVYILVDGMFLGNVVGPRGLAAVNLVLPAWSLMSGVGLMIGIGGGTLISIRLGAGDREGARRMFSMVFAALLAVAFGAGVLGWAFAEPLAGMLGATADVRPQVVVYTRLTAAFMFAYLINYFFDYMLRASGRPRLAMAILAGAAFLNIGLDYVAIVVLDGGVAGAAWASGFAQAAAFAAMAYALVQPKDGYSLRPRRMPWRTLKKALYNGSSELFTEISFGVSTLIYNLALMERIGVLGVSAFAVVMYINVILAFLVFGFAISIQPLISINYGAGRFDRVRAILKTAYGYGLSLVGFATLIILSQRDLLVGLFVADEPALFALASRALGIVTLNFVFMGVNVISSSYFTAIEWAGTSVLISILRGVAFTFVGVQLLPLFLGTDGVWWTSPFAEWATLMVVVPLVLANRKWLWRRERGEEHA